MKEMRKFYFQVLSFTDFSTSTNGTRVHLFRCSTSNICWGDLILRADLTTTTAITVAVAALHLLVLYVKKKEEEAQKFITT